MKPKINTMEELSEAIGVSRPTLSRYFQSPDSVRGKTSEKIRQGLERVEYVPNFFATRMNRKTTGIIGVIIPYLNDLFFTKLLMAIETAAMEAGYTVITQCSHSDPSIEARAAETLMSMSVDGALVAPLGDQSDPEVQRRLGSRLPFMLVDSRPTTMPDVDFVGTDHKQSTGLITEYLCRVGRPPVFLAMPRVNFNAVERENAYIAKLTELGHKPEVIGIDPIDSRWHFEAHGEAVLDQYFSHGAYLDRSILCVNDRVAIGALRAASRHGLVPGRMAKGGLRIAGHDDYPLCPFTTPALTTVAQNVEAIGKASVSRLVEMIRGENSANESQVQLFDGVLKLRESA
ncbi:LacI family DNA-binding transcriptional regulator [Pseudorhodobacter wandonensis]|jgi:DNA-binding LacI/PurR family transcriptional regulator|uniref:LacI family DNA-binding transcriptional regulator n=1 Tax=Pseudorhodobacter wandonensis TaxID=1120568 RepID=UPI000ADA8443|nr:LacI family DNA-binding transcriptional regulator [Pseudorhodobacter wandonensis]